MTGNEFVRKVKALGRARNIPVVLNAALYVAMRRAGISKLQLAKRLGVDEKEVRRLLDPHYGSKLPRIAKAISVLGQRLVIGVEAA